MEHHHRDMIHLKIKSIDQIFDAGDPEPISMRQLNPAWLEYIHELLEEKSGTGPIALNLEAQGGALGTVPKEEVITALRQRIVERRQYLRRKLKENFRLGRASLGIGLVTLALFIFLSQATSFFHLGIFEHAFREGFLIIGWVAMWRPVEILLYDWWPFTENRRKLKRLLAGKITIATE